MSSVITASCATFGWRAVRPGSRTSSSRTGATRRTRAKVSTTKSWAVGECELKCRTEDLARNPGNEAHARVLARALDRAAVAATEADPGLALVRALATDDAADATTAADRDLATGSATEAKHRRDVDADGTGADRDRIAARDPGAVRMDRHVVSFFYLILGLVGDRRSA